MVLSPLHTLTSVEDRIDDDDDDDDDDDEVLYSAYIHIIETCSVRSQK